MKKIITFSLAIYGTLAFSQVAVGKVGITNTSVSLEFGNQAGKASTQRGIILPWTTSKADVSGAVPGTMIYDLSDKKVKYLKYNDGTASNEWFDLSVDNTGTANDLIQRDLQESSLAKTTIGKPKDTPGILVLEDNDKAMILPLVDKYSVVENPSAGMMVYDLANDMLCVFNGTVWSFWKP